MKQSAHAREAFGVNDAIKAQLDRLTEAMKPVRPTVYTPELGDRICECLAAGKNLRTFCIWPDWPTKKTVLAWVKEQPAFGERYRSVLRERTKAQPGSSATSTRDQAHPRARDTETAAAMPENSHETAMRLHSEQ